ncbi:MAG: D-tyrosyl-tRNA(Tyr) deacylase [Kiritimatiellae bacterium]|nr:D-tyrosyl-tRNA(Tyr) deacylase [Kiritimatiellia bacterium]
MKALIQRVSRGSVSVGGKVEAEIGRGFVVLLGVMVGDGVKDAEYLARKTVNLRIFPDAEDRMNLSIQDIGGEILVISQFTLCANTRKGNRPSFIDAAEPSLAEDLYEAYTKSLRQVMGDARVATGVFRSTMTVEIINEGPVTIELRSDGEDVFLP